MKIVFDIIELIIKIVEGGFLIFLYAIYIYSFYKIIHTIPKGIKEDIKRFSHKSRDIVSRNTENTTEVKPTIRRIDISEDYLAPLATGAGIFFIGSACILAYLGFFVVLIEATIAFLTGTAQMPEVISDIFFKTFCVNGIISISIIILCVISMIIVETIKFVSRLFHKEKQK